MGHFAIDEEIVMKYSLLVSVIAMSFAAVTGIARADGGQKPLPTVSVENTSRRAVDCTPPNDSSDCAALHAQIRARFTESEITMLFGSATASKEYPTSYSHIKQEYQKFLENYQNEKDVVVVAVGNPVTVSKP
jgi:hypothetical protein